MKVRAVRDRLQDVRPTIVRTGTEEMLKFPVELGREYLVYGVASIFDPNSNFGFTQYELEDEFGRLLPFPAGLFEVTDARVSKYWLAQLSDEFFYLRTREFVDNIYLSDEIHDDLPGARAMLQQIKARLEAEAVD